MILIFVFHSSSCSAVLFPGFWEKGPSGGSKPFRNFFHFLYITLRQLKIYLSFFL